MSKFITSFKLLATALVMSGSFTACILSEDPVPNDNTTICGDGSQLLCRRAEPECPQGQVAEIVNNCYGNCVDPDTCEAPKPKVCGDGSQLLCLQAEPECPQGQVAEIVNNCYGECVDAKTCEVPQAQSVR